MLYNNGAFSLPTVFTPANSYRYRSHKFMIVTTLRRIILGGLLPRPRYVEENETLAFYYSKLLLQ